MAFDVPRCVAQTLAVVLIGGTSAGWVIHGGDGAAGATGATLGRSEERVLRAPRVVVIKSTRTLYLFDGARLVRSYPIDLGAVPTGTKTRKGDNRTPEGRFTIRRIHPNSPYRRFLGIDYPDRQAVARGLARGYVSEGEARGMLDALDDGRCPDWGTALGGGIGIHGHARGTDWTAGCIAVADDDIEELFNVLRLGDPVEILP